MQTDTGQLPLDDAYSYQRGDIYRYYQARPDLQVHLSNPAPRIRIHAEIGDGDASAALQMIAPETGEPLLLP